MFDKPDPPPGQRDSLFWKVQELLVVGYYAALAGAFALGGLIAWFSFYTRNPVETLGWTAVFTVPVLVGLTVGAVRNRLQSRRWNQISSRGQAFLPED